MNLKLSLIVAMSKDGVIGNQGQLPWNRIPEDMRLFHKLTLGKPIIMGRRTWESMSQPLGGRINIILSRSLNLMTEQYYGKDLLHIVRTPAEAIVEAFHRHKEAVVIGGSEIYRIFGPMCDEAHLTTVHKDIQGDTWFPMEIQEPWVLTNPGEWIAENVSYRHYTRRH